jgi:hypothetical protein
VATQIKIIRSVDYLSVTEEGEVDFEESKRNLYSLAEPKRPPADCEILMDFRRTQWILSTEDIYQLARVVIEYPDSFRDKIAILVLPGVNFDRNEFQGLCAAHKGITVGTFTNYEDAIQWFYG